MVMLVFGPRGVPASYRHMQGFGVNTYKWVNEAGETVLVKYHWHPKQGVKSWTEADAGAMQGEVLGVHTKDLYDAIAAGDYPEWDLYVQIMSDDDHPELDFDPLDDTKTWPENEFPLRHVGRHGAQPRAEELLRRVRADRVRHRRARRRARLLRRQDARRADVLLLRHAAPPGRHRTTCSCPSTRPRSASRPTSATATMTYFVDETGENPSVNYEPSITGGLAETPKPGTVEAGAADRRAADARADRAHERLPAGRRALPALRAVGARRPRREPHRTCSASATARSRSG